MRRLRKKIISDMRAIGLVRTSSVDRVQSQDDYCLVTSTGYSGRTLSTYTNQTNQFMKSGPGLLADSGRYEQTRRLSRYNMFWEQHDNRCTMLTFNSAPQEYQYIFNEIKDAYLGMR